MGGTRPRSLVRAVSGPIMLITVGVLFALNNFTQYSFFGHTWPVLLIVWGLLILARRGFGQPPEPPPSGFPPGTYSQGTYRGGPSPGGMQPK
jgi:hypothetical protein